MLHAKFQNHRTSGSAEEDLKRFLLFIAMAAILAIYINFHCPILTIFHIKFGFDWPGSFRADDVCIFGHVHVYSQTTPLGQNFFININILSICPFPASFAPQIIFILF